MAGAADASAECVMREFNKKILILCACPIAHDTPYYANYMHASMPQQDRSSFWKN